MLRNADVSLLGDDRRRLPGRGHVEAHARLRSTLAHEHHDRHAGRQRTGRPVAADAARLPWNLTSVGLGERDREPVRPEPVRPEQDRAHRDLGAAVRSDVQPGGPLPARFPTTSVPFGSFDVSAAREVSVPTALDDGDGRNAPVTRSADSASPSVTHRTTAVRMPPSSDGGRSRIRVSRLALRPASPRTRHRRRSAP